MNTPLNRREFIGATVGATLAGTAAAGSLVFGFPTTAAAQGAAPEVNAWVVVQPDEKVVIRIARSEMGQGTLTGLAQLVAEELECDWARVTTEYPTPGQNLARKRVWGNFSTGGSRGIRESQDLGAQAEQLSGHGFMSPATQALQNDDTQNPAFLWVADGQQRFDAACASCHTRSSLRGVAIRYPAWDATLGKPVTLSARINLCQVRHVKTKPFAPESDPLLGLETFVAYQSRGMPVQPPADARLAPFVQLGQRLYRQRFGQLDLACAQCHDPLAGRRLAGSTIPQAHPTGYPLYRLEWQAVGSLQRRLRHCMSGVRAEPYAFASDELMALELYLMQRAAGMPLETPAVRP